MLTNPNALGVEDSLKNANTDPLDRPIPGQSLTGDMGRYAWEKPAEFTDVNEAFEVVVNSIKANKRTQKGYDEVITLGMPLESITNTITFGGFVEGKWSVDVAEMLKPPIMAFLMLYSEEKGLPFIPFNNDSSTLETPVDKMDNFDFLSTMAENNPKAHTMLKTSMSEASDELIRKQADSSLLEDSFLQVESPKEITNG
jgi:hypothetical protein|tara:strand:+ start:499 stop:1095 length:597 start_codon:yes stop_codon:yes gene_type:complete